MKKLIFMATTILFASFTLKAEIASNPSILYIGDSHSYGKFGLVIDKNLSKLSDHLVLESSCGSTANTWLGKSGFEKTVCGFWKKDGTLDERSVNHQIPKFSDELAKYQPKVVIIQLGTNMAAATNPKNSAPSIEQLIQESMTNGRLCIWIGPPDANSKIVTKEKLQVVNNMLKELTSKNNCHYIDSLELTKFPKTSSEGIHYPPSLSAEWGEKVSLKIVDILQSIEH